MAERDHLLRAVQAARNGTDLAAAVMALDAHDRQRTASLARSRELDLSAADVRQTLEPLPAFERHTAATDWVGDYEAPSDYRTAMIAEASQWYRGVPREVLEDREEFNEQALGHAYTAASAYGSHALAARREFMTYVGYLTRSGASGLPQIQQTIDPNNSPAETPLPEQAFDNFAPPQNEFNDAIESPDHSSQISSEQAPGIQELQRQQGGGSGFGSGPERPVEHSVSMDTADGYSEVPPGQPGQIPANVAGPAPSAPSTPNPIAGENMDEGSERRPTVASYTRPDHEGFRWRLTAAVGEELTEPVPFHERCGSLHWPDEACGNGQAHVASMAIGYVTSFEDQMRRDRFENLGAAEGVAVLRAVGTTLGKVAQHHNTLIASFKAEARSEDEIAWLRGYLARVRPVLAGGGLQCEGCGQPLKPGKTGSCKGCRTAAKRHGGRLDFQIAAEAALTRQGIDYSEGLPPMTVHDMRMHLWKTHGLSARSLSAQERAHSGSVDELMTHLTKIHRKDHGAVGAMDHPHGAIDRSIVGTQPSHDVKAQDKLPGKLTDGDQPDKGSLAKGAAGDSVPLRICPQCGSTYCKHWQGRDKPYDLPGEPYGMAKDASLAKGAPFAGYKDFAACVAANSDKNDPEAYCGKIKHQVEGMVAAFGQDQDQWDRWNEHARGADEDESSANYWDTYAAEHHQDMGPQSAASDRQHEAASSLPQIQEHTDSHDNPDPGGDQLNTAVMFPLNPGWVNGQGGGEGDDDAVGSKSKQAARSGMTPSSSAVKMFGRMDAMEGKRPHHKSNYPFSGKAHGQYMRGWNETRGTIDGALGKDPISHADYADWSGRPDLHKHYMGVYGDAKAGRDLDVTSRIPEERAWSNEPGRGASLRRQADFMTKPLQSTDDDHPPFNSEQTTPDPYSSTEGGGDFAAGQKEGREDAANGEKPTFSDNSSRVSPYVQGYAQGYFGGQQAPGSQDVPHSIGGDSGQAMNSGQAATQWQVAQASRKTAACLGCPHPPHLGQPCGAEGCRHYHNPGEEGAGPGMHARTIGHVPDPDYPGYSKKPDYHTSPTERVSPLFAGQEDLYEGSGNRHDDSGYASDYGRYNDDGSDNDPGGRHSSSLRVSASFVTRQATAEPDFRKAYRFAAQWRQNSRLVAQGSAAFEAGLYAGFCDRPVPVQVTWVRAHQQQAASHPELASRIEAHASFSRKLALASGGRVRVSARTGCYPVTAAAETGGYDFLGPLPRKHERPHHAMSDARLSASGTGKPHHVHPVGLTSAGDRRFVVSGRRPRAAHFTAMPDGSWTRTMNGDTQAIDRPQGQQMSYIFGEQAGAPKTAATSVDLITDGPGTSPDPMGSTPLNGPGQPPPMGGQEDPAASGGPPPYQQTEPAGHGPVAPDDVLGTPQAPPSESGPFTQTYSGRHPGNIDLAPVAPNLAGGSGYSNVDANQGNPGHMQPHKEQQALAFRRVVQAGLARRRALQSA